MDKDYWMRQIEYARREYIRQIEPIIKIEMKILNMSTRIVLYDDNTIERKFTPEMEEELRKIREIKNMILYNIIRERGLDHETF